jgi:hypothetical protein
MRYAMVENVLIFVIRNFLATTVGITLERISGIALLSVEGARPE